MCVAFVHLAFRFHVNFYHSYRGDTPDEAGFGKDIRVIRKILDILDRLNADGIPVKGTWDFDNLFSLQRLMPRYCPDIIERVRVRIREQGDEINLMAFNNGIVPALPPAELEAAVRRTVTNRWGSGVRDVFGVTPTHMRLQEMMFTPAFLSVLPALGVESVSLFYSALPFNAFSLFVPPLEFRSRYNPLCYRYPGIHGELTVLPVYGFGDLIDHLSLRRWVKSLWREARKQRAETDLLLLIDADADDEVWLGYGIPPLTMLTDVAGGLDGLVRSVADLPNLCFSTPELYTTSHPPLGELSFGQDTADGSFDGYSSWAEKHENHLLWSLADRARLDERRAKTLIESGRLPEESAARLRGRLEAVFEDRLELTTTTHFGLASPVLNVHRFERGLELARKVEGETASVLADALDEYRRRAVPATGKRSNPAVPATEDCRPEVEPASGRYTLAFPATESDHHLWRGAVLPAGRAPLRLPAGDGGRRELRHVPLPGQEVVTMDPSSHAGAPGSSRKQAAAEPAARGVAAAASKQGSSKRIDPADAPGPVTLDNGLLRLELRGATVPSLQLSGIEFAAGDFLTTALRYGRRLLQAGNWHRPAGGPGRIEGPIASPGVAPVPVSVVPIEVCAWRGELNAAGSHGSVTRRFALVHGLPYLYFDTVLEYPATASRRNRRGRVARLGREYDGLWREVMPCELAPALYGTPGRPLRVWKRGALGSVTSFPLGPGGGYFTDACMDSSNNAVAVPWIAVGDGEKGLLVAWSAEVRSSPAFCPLRTRPVPGRIAENWAERPEGDRRDGRPGGTAGAVQAARRSARKGSAYTVRLNPFGTYDGRQPHYPTAATGLGRFFALHMADHLGSYAPSYNGRTAAIGLMIAPYVGNEPPLAVQADAEAFAWPPVVVSGGEG